MVIGTAKAGKMVLLVLLITMCVLTGLEKAGVVSLTIPEPAQRHRHHQPEMPMRGNKRNPSALKHNKLPICRRSTSGPIQMELYTRDARLTSRYAPKKFETKGIQYAHRRLELMKSLSCTVEYIEKKVKKYTYAGTHFGHVRHEPMSDRISHALSTLSHTTKAQNTPYGQNETDLKAHLGDADGHGYPSFYYGKESSYIICILDMAISASLGQCVTDGYSEMRQKNTSNGEQVCITAPRQVLDFEGLLELCRS